MKSKKITFVVLSVLLSSGLSFPQSSSDIKPEFVPDIDGILKTKIEFDLNNSNLRFEVRNARFGAKGNINRYVGYRAEIDLSDEGKVKMLDAFVRIQPVSFLNLYLGQRKIPFSSDYIRNPAENIFANRSFLTKYINEGLRDIGFYADFKFNTAVPFTLLLGAVNGTGNNNPQWIDRPNVVNRITLGSDDGLRVAGNVYYGEAPEREDLAMFGGEIRYAAGNFFIESEYISRNWTDTLSSRIHDDGIYLHSYYNIRLKESMIYMLTPTARLDIIGNSVLGGDTDASRLTLGLNAGFEPKQFTAEIRLNYENYFKSALPTHTDKITIEFLARF